MESNEGEWRKQNKTRRKQIKNIRKEDNKKP